MSSCRLCGRVDLRSRHRIGPYLVDECPGCGLVQVAAQPSTDDLARLYGEEYFDRGKYGDAFAERKENEARLRWLAAAGVPPRAKLLDAGCATGGFLRLAAEHYDAWGFDLSAEAVAQARQAHPALADRIRQGRMEEQNYPPESFDAIVLWDVLEHLPDPVAAGRRLVNWLKPGGLLCLSTPNIGSTTARLMGRRWAFMTVPEHLVFFRRESLVRLLRDGLGLEPVRWTTRGKWANLGFLFYKLKRVFPRLVPQGLIAAFRAPLLRKLAVYVPTGDIQYAAARKNLGPGERVTPHG